MAKPTVSMCYCTQCGFPFPILRTNKKIREPGHLKKLWCNKCKKETNFIEIRGFGKYTYEDFLIEFKYGNFSPEGERIEPHWKKFVSEHKKGDN